MSGVAGGDRIEAPHVRSTTDNYVSNVLSKFPGFTSADISGSFNYGNREDFGDIDVVTVLSEAPPVVVMTALPPLPLKCDNANLFIVFIVGPQYA